MLTCGARASACVSDSQKLRYFLWAGAQMWSDRDVGCPGCGSSKTREVRKKYLVTSLWECGCCGLRFRVPKDDESQSQEFYQRSYSAGFTTDLPSPEALNELRAKGFTGSEKDFKPYISVLNCLGLKSGDTLLDFGSSWGYGSWQLRQYGFTVLSYEISVPRADYARTALGCEMVGSFADLRGRIECLFSSHVIEHLPRPDVLWEIAKEVLVDDGLIVCFCPNGEPQRESRLGRRKYDNAWGKVHPLMVTPKFLINRSAFHGFAACTYSTPYNPDNIGCYKSDHEVIGDELCMVARRTSARCSCS